MKKTHTIDAAGKALGRIASEAAKVLLGKDSVSFDKHVVADVEVAVKNAAQMTFGQRKALQKIYRSHTGFPGGFKEESHQKLVARKGNGEAIRRAVSNMLPKNKLRSLRMKRLVITE